jgi:hypothetical protein
MAQWFTLLCCSFFSTKQIEIYRKAIQKMAIKSEQVCLEQICEWQEGEDRGDEF